MSRGGAASVATLWGFPMKTWQFRHRRRQGQVLRSPSGEGGLTSLQKHRSGYQEVFCQSASRKVTFWGERRRGVLLQPLHLQYRDVI